MARSNPIGGYFGKRYEVYAGRGGGRAVKRYSVLADANRHAIELLDRGTHAYVYDRRSGRAVGPFANPTDVEVRERFDRCVRDVAARGGAYNPFAICAAQMRKSYGTQFQRIAAQGRSGAAAERHARGEVRARASGRLERRPVSRLRLTAVQRRGELGRIRAESAEAYRRAYGLPVAPANVTGISEARRRIVERAERQAAAASRRPALRAVANPTVEVLQARRFGPGATSFEWINVARGRWVDASQIAGEPRRPPRKPGEHLVAPGAQLLVVQGSGGPELQYVRALFVRHHHRWRFLAPMGKPERVQLGSDGIHVPAHLEAGDEHAVRHLVRHAIAHQHHHRAHAAAER